MRCRVCGEWIAPDLELLAELGAKPTANSHDDCIYKCRCGAGYSNAQGETLRKLIWPMPAQNVPAQVHEELEPTLAAACNVFNRSNKRAKFCFETSEDAVTWTVFRALQRTGELGLLIDEPRPSGTASLVLWGAPAGGPRAEAVALELESISRQLGEDERRRSEPDAIVVWNDLTVVVEAKYRSGNDWKPDYANIPRYLDRLELFVFSTEEVRAAGWYELVRNWRIGVELAERLGMDHLRLINLGPVALARSADEFARSISQNVCRSFVHLTWSALLDRMPAKEDWLDAYAKERGLYTR
jgi:hypothetical protein